MKAAESDRRRIIYNAVVSWLGFAAQIGVAFYLCPILVHGLGQDRYGLWALAESVLVYLTLLDLGIAVSLVRYTARFEATGDHDSLNRTFSASLRMFTAAGFVALILATAITGLGLWVPAPWSPDGAPLLAVPAAYRLNFTWVLLLLGFNLAIGLPLNVFPSLLDGLGRFPAKTSIRTAGLVLRVPLCLWLVHGEDGLVRLALLQLACNVLEHLVIAGAVWWYLPWLRFTPRKVDWATLKTIGGYSVDAFLAMLAGRISFQTDALVINQVLGAASITPFAVVHRLVEQAKNALRAVTTVLTPAVSAWEAKKDNDAIRKLLLDGTRWVQWLIVPVQVGLLVLGPAFLTLWMGPEYRDSSYPTLVILAVPLGLAMAQSIAARILYGVGRLKLFARVVLAEAFVNLVMSIVLAWPLGIEGVALGTSVPNLIGNAIVIGYVCHLFGVRAGEYVRLALLGPHLLGLLLGAGWLLAVTRFPIGSWTTFLLTGFVGLAIYLPCTVLIEIGPKGGLGRLWPGRWRGL
jgi:O-antigen/teichoic acid export membrane protein